ncbi:MAG TPA: hypothetical protein VF406_01050 [Thermodesulfobacteriota bacterium]
MSRILVGLLIFQLVGTPMAYFLWSTLNEGLAMQASAWRIALAFPVLALYIGLLVVMARQIRRWQAAREADAARHSGGARA